MSARPANATHDLLGHVEESIRTRDLVRRGQRVLVAVSGGMDSVALLHLLHALAPRQRWKLVVAHFNHQLRGAASLADERFVRALARQLRLPFVHARWPRSEQHRSKAFGLEMAARLARHTFLAQAATAARCRTIALAHHADDQVELYFLRLLRGAGGEGLRGMKWSGPAWAGTGLTLIRPLLDQTRKGLESFAREQSLRHRTDATNLDLARDRNWIRHELIPRLARRFGSAPQATVLRSMELVGSEADFVQGAAERWLEDGRGFSKLHPAVQRQVLRLQLRRGGVAADFDLVERLRAQPNRTVMTAGGVNWRRDEEGRVSRLEPPRTSFDSNTLGLRLTPAGSQDFDGVLIRWRLSRVVGPAGRLRARAGREVFDAAKVGSVVRLRHWRPGDRFQPIGLAQATKLQDLFTNLKIPAADRRTRLVAEAASGEIFWVEGVRMAEKFKVTTRTRRTLEWRWRRPKSGT